MFVIADGLPNEGGVAPLRHRVLCDTIILNSMEAIIRTATRKDEREMFTLARAAPTLITLDFTAFRRSFESVLADLSTVLLVAEVGNDVVGYLLGHRHTAFYAAGYIASVDDLFVSSRVRHGGIGKQLMDQFEMWADQRGCLFVGLATSHASDFYERLGFTSKAGYYKKYLRNIVKGTKVGDAFPSS